MFTKTPASENSATEFKSQLTKGQIELLDDYIGHEGIYLQTIRENQDFDVGTKLLYLERAISVQPKYFLADLQKLCLSPETASTIELTRAFKFINDLYFDNQIKYGVHGVKKTIDHFFNGFGIVDVSELQFRIKEIINAEIILLQNDATNDQKYNRRREEDKIIGNENLAVIFDLPIFQRVPCFELRYNAQEWESKKSVVRDWLLNLRVRGIIDDIFVDGTSPRISYSITRVLFELSWSDIPFTRQNVSKALTRPDHELSMFINTLHYYKLDNQNNFDVISQPTVRIFTHNLRSIINALDEIGIPVNQSNFDKLIRNKFKSEYLERIFSKIQFIPDVMKQQELDRLMGMVEFSKDICQRMEAIPQNQLINKDMFIDILNDVWTEKMCPTQPIDLDDARFESSPLSPKNWR